MIKVLRRFGRDFVWLLVLLTVLYKTIKTLRRLKHNKQARILQDRQKFEHALKECEIEANFACRVAYLRIKHEMSKAESD